VNRVEIVILGSGTSQGIPAIGCRCATCTSTDPRDMRLRPSVLIRTSGTTFLIDTSSDFRQQMLRHDITRIDAVLMTHAHFDHIGGFDDLRQFNYLQKGLVPLYGNPATLEHIEQTFRYAFGHAMQEGGGVPQVTLTTLEPGLSRDIAGVTVLPLNVMHGVLPILGYRIGGVAYITDTNFIPEETLSMLDGLDLLILDALRHTPHPTHYCLEESIAVARRIGARRTCFTHIAHNIMHKRDSGLLPEGMEFCFDGMMLATPMEPA
jgi:phosphoribosyl 1,2-cyclic phosphate phosphodiesterase